MPFICNACAEPRGGDKCKKKCIKKYGDMGATRIPPLDGMVTFMTEDFNEKQHTILKALCGSKAYKLDTPDSDTDMHGVFVYPTMRFFEVGKPKPDLTSWVEGQDEDATAWEVNHFLHLATRCNPTILETFVAPVIWENAWGRSLRRLFPAVLARERIYESFKGYANNQLKKMLDNRQEEVRTWKFAVAYLRVLYQGIELLNTGTYDPAITHVGRNHFLRDIKKGEHKKGTIVDQTEKLLVEMKQAYENSTIQEEPDLERINAYIYQIRQGYF